MDDFAKWLGDLQDGPPSPGEHSALKTALQDRAVRRRCVEELLLSVGLLECLKVQTAAVDAGTTASGRIKVPAASSSQSALAVKVEVQPGYNWSRILVWGSMAACLMLAVFFACSSGWLQGMGLRNQALTMAERVWGDVNVARGHLVFKCQPEQPLKDGDVLTTGNAAYLQIAYADSSTIVLGPESTLELHGEGLTQGLAGAMAGRGVKLLQGQLQARVAPQKEGFLLLKTNEAAIRVLGTEFILKASPQKSAVDLLKGELAISTQKGDKSIQMPGGWGTQISAAGVIEQPTPLGERYGERKLHGRIIQVDESLGRMIVEDQANRQQTFFMGRACVPLAEMTNPSHRFLPGQRVSLTYVPGVWNEMRQIEMQQGP